MWNGKINNIISVVTVIIIVVVLIIIPELHGGENCI